MFSTYGLTAVKKNLNSPVPLILSMPQQVRENTEANFWMHLEQVPETLPEEVLGKMSAPPKGDTPIITPADLAEADGFVFGFPTRFGMMAAQFKAFLDATGGLWRTQQLAGKPAGIFYSTGSQGGGQETTA